MNNFARLSHHTETTASDPRSAPHASLGTVDTARAARGRALAGLGATCSLLFGLVHFYWAIGGTVGTDDAKGAMSDRPWFLAYDIAAGIIFVAVAAGAAALSAKVGNPRLRAQLVTACRWGGSLALLRGGLALVQDVAMFDEIRIGVVYDLVFTLGGLIFLRAARLLRSRGDFGGSDAVEKV